MKTAGKLSTFAILGLGLVFAYNFYQRPPARDPNFATRVALLPVTMGKPWDNSSSPLVPRESTSQEEVTAGGSFENSQDLDQLRAWARINPQKAREWLAHAAPGAPRDAVSEMVCQQIAETNPAVAVCLADSFGVGCTNVLDNLMQQWAERDIQSAYKWVVAEPSSTQRDSLLGRIALAESRFNPQDAATLVAEQISPGPLQDEAAMSVLNQWAQKDPDAAMIWAQSFSTAAIHDRAVNEVQNVVRNNSPSAHSL